jgi:hypothetical protein
MAEDEGSRLLILLFFSLFFYLQSLIFQKTERTGNNHILTPRHSVQHSVTAVNKNHILRYNPLPAVLTSLCQVTQPYDMQTFHVQTAVYV